MFKPFQHIFTGRLLQNSFWTLADLVLYPLLMVLATPLFINGLGPAQYGLWMMLTVIVQLMQALNFGVGDSTIRQTAALRAAGNHAEIPLMVNRNLSLAVLLTLLTTLLGTLTGFCIHHFELLASGAHHDVFFIEVLVLFSVSAGLRFTEQVLLSVLKGHERFDVSARLSMVSRLSVVVCSAIVVLNGGGLIHMAITTVVCNVLNIVLQLAVVSRVVQGLQLMPHFRFHSREDVFQQNGWFWLQSVIALTGFLADRLVIGIYGSMETVGYYSVAALIGTQIHNVLLAFGAFAFPKVSARVAQERDIADLYYVARFMIAALGWSLTAFFVLAASPLLSWWLGESTYHEAASMITMYLTFETVILLIVVPYHFINGSTHLKWNSIFEFLLRGTHVALMAWWYPLYGVQGVLWALLAGTLLHIPLQYYVFHSRILKRPSVAEPLLAVLPAFLLSAAFLMTQLLWQILFLAAALIVFKFVYWDKAKTSFKLHYGQQQ
jgi:O-antigen/teichoic acid export membrane protein